MLLIKKIALVTGAASGMELDLATARRFVQRGAMIWLSDFDAGVTEQ